MGDQKIKIVRRYPELRIRIKKDNKGEVKKLPKRVSRSKHEFLKERKEWMGQKQYFKR